MRATFDRIPEAVIVAPLADSGVEVVELHRPGRRGLEHALGSIIRILDGSEPAPYGPRPRLPGGISGRAW